MESERLKRKIDLENDFKRLLDKSWLHQLGGLSDQELDQKYPCLGAGRQFRSWRIPVVGGGGGGGGFVTLKKPTMDFTVHKRDFHDWLGILGLLKGAWKETLIPPLYVVIDQSDLVFNRGLHRGNENKVIDRKGQNRGTLVMPYGQPTPTKQTAEEAFAEGEATHGLESMIARTDQWLFSRGLELRDIPQIKWWGEVPFIVDLGDIYRKSR